MREMVDNLILEEGDEVTFVGPDPESCTSLVKVICTGFWTSWLPREFIGDDWEKCLDQALKQRVR